MHVLAGRIGGMTVEELGARMSARERERWRILLGIEAEERWEAEMDAGLEARAQSRLGR